MHVGRCAECDVRHHKNRHHKMRHHHQMQQVIDQYKMAQCPTCEGFEWDFVLGSENFISTLNRRHMLDPEKQSWSVPDRFLDNWDGDCANMWAPIYNAQRQEIHPSLPTNYWDSLILAFLFIRRLVENTDPNGTHAATRTALYDHNLGGSGKPVAPNQIVPIKATKLGPFALRHLATAAISEQRKPCLPEKGQQIAKAQRQKFV